MAKAAAAGVPLHELPLAEMRKIEPKITKAVFEVLSVERSVRKPHELWRNSAEERASTGAEMAKNARSGALINAAIGVNDEFGCRSAMVHLIQELALTRSCRFRAGMIGMLAAALLLSGCGRKGALDLPPGAGMQPGAPPARGMQQDFDEEGKPIAPRDRERAKPSIGFSTEPPMHHFAYRDGVLHAEAVNLASLAQAVGTPFYCYSTATLERHYRVFAGRFRDVAVARLLRGQGQFQPGGDRHARKARRSADVVSGGELKRALAAGVRRK